MAFPWHPGKRKPRQKRYKRRKIGGVSQTVGAVDPAAVFAPSDEGAVKCNAFDWGRDFFRLSPSVTPYGVPPADGGGLPLSLRDISLTL